MYKVSVIIPIYNKEKSIKRCLDCLKSQSYNNLEFILVNDGSTDGSFKICNSLIHQDNRFKIINQNNQGIGSARNTGMQAATGEFISFVDADDFIYPDYIKGLVEQQQKYHSDIAVCDSAGFKKDPGLLILLRNEREKLQGKYKCTEWINKAGQLSSVFGIGNSFFCVFAKIIRRKCCQGVFFPESREFSEDIRTMWKFYLNANSISYESNTRSDETRHNMYNSYLLHMHPDSAERSAGKLISAVRNTEEEMAYLGALGFDTHSFQPVYQKLLTQAQSLCIDDGDYDNYRQITFKLNNLNKFRQNLL